MKEIKNNSDWLFIPFLSINSLGLSKQRISSAFHGFDQYFSCFDSQFLNKNNGFVVPLIFLNNANFYKNEDGIYTQIESNRIITNTLLRTRNVNMEIKVFDDLLNFKELLPDYVSHITYSLFNRNLKTLLRNKGAKIREMPNLK